MILGILIYTISFILICVCNNGMYLTRNTAKLIFFDEDVDNLTQDCDNNSSANITENYINNTLVTLYQNGLENVSTKDLIEMSLLKDNVNDETNNEENNKQENNTKENIKDEEIQPVD